MLLLNMMFILQVDEWFSVHGYTTSEVLMAVLEDAWLLSLIFT